MQCRLTIRKGREKINWGGQKVKGVINYLTSQSPTEKNSFHLGNAKDNSGQVNILNDLAAALRALSKTTMCHFSSTSKEFVIIALFRNLPIRQLTHAAHRRPRGCSLLTGTHSRRLADAWEILRALFKAEKSSHGKVTKTDPTLGISETCFEDQKKPINLLGGVTPEWGILVGDNFE